MVLPTGIVPYRTYGDEAAPAVVMLHGLRGDHHGLEPIVSHLSGLRVVVPDLPGFGETPPLLGRRHDLPGYAAWARTFVETVAPGAALAGWTCRGSCWSPRSPAPRSPARGRS